MTDKEFHSLKRPELLRLLLEQGKELQKVREELRETQFALQQSDALCDRLKDKLDAKDEQIERLKEKLNAKDEQIEKLKGRLDRKDAQIADLRGIVQRQQSFRKIEAANAGSIAEAALKLNEIFEVAQKAADQYLYNIQKLEQGHPEEDAIAAADAQRLRQLDADLEADRKQVLEEEQAQAAAVGAEGPFAG